MGIAILALSLTRWVTLGWKTVPVAHPRDTVHIRGVLSAGISQYLALLSRLAIGRGSPWELNRQSHVSKQQAEG